MPPMEKGFFLRRIFDNFNDSHSMKSFHWYLGSGIVLLAVATVVFLKLNGGSSDIPETVSYNFHIRPIISDRCFKCHGPDVNQRKADLRLDSEKGLFGHLKDDPGAFVIK